MGILRSAAVFDSARNEADAFVVLLVVIAVAGDRRRPRGRRPAPIFCLVRTRHLPASA